jgi:ribosome maturation factor RimP
VVVPVVEAAGYDLEELTLTRAGRRFVVRVMVDADGGINLDAVAVVSRGVSDALDAAEEAGGELLSGEYQLEVSSPGVDRPLTLPRHWRRNVARLVATTVDGTALTARLTAADDTGVVLDVDGTTREVAYPQLGPGRVQIEFNRVEEADLGESDLDDDDLDDDDDDDFDDEDGEGEDK